MFKNLIIPYRMLNLRLRNICHIINNILINYFSHSIRPIKWKHIYSIFYGSNLILSISPT